MLESAIVHVTPAITCPQLLDAVSACPWPTTKLKFGGEILIELRVQELTLKGTRLLDSVPAVTTTGPVVAADGTVATIFVLVQEVIPAVTPLNLTEPTVVPNFVPLTVTDAPVGPLFGKRFEIPGVTLNCFALLATPPTVTTTFPVLAVLGTRKLMRELPQDRGVIVVEPILMVLPPWVTPKLPPETNTGSIAQFVGK